MVIQRAPALVMLFAFLFAGATLPAQNQPQSVHIVVDLSPNDVVIDSQFAPSGQLPVTRVDLRVSEPVARTGELGLPDLPFLTRSIAMPVGSQVTSVSVTPGQTVAIQGVGRITWGQLPQVGGPNQPPRFPTGADGSQQFTYYEAPEAVPPSPLTFQFPVWPQQPTELVETRTVAGYLVYIFRVYPVRYLPAQGVLTVDTSLAIDLSYAPGPAVVPHSFAEAMAIEGLKSSAANPTHIAEPHPLTFPAGPDTRYLIITDGFKWNPDITRGPSVGNMLAEFQRLAEWKSEKGVKASVVTITNIVNGKYGDFVTGALDLQEVIRNFLKHASRDWSTYWVLLGGDVEIVPVRQVAAHINIHPHYIWRDDSKPIPDDFHCSFDSATKSLRIKNSKEGDGILDSSFGPGTWIVSQKTGTAFARVARIPSPTDPGWIYTDASYSGDTSFYSDFIILRGADADVLGTDFYTVQYNNSIPTDLYYASLAGPDYDVPGLHDWDRNGNGLYGQYSKDPVSAGGLLDGVNFEASLELGRAPVSSPAEAKAFVDKVLAYERYEGMTPFFGRRLLLAADNWYGGPGVSRDAADPPAKGKYYLKDADTTAKLHFSGAPGGLTFRLFAWNAADFWYEIPYSTAASDASMGYFFCTKGDYATPSVSGSDPVATEFVKVRGKTFQINPAWYFFNPAGADLAVTEKEAVKDILAARAPALNLRKRLYADLQDTPDYLTFPGDLNGLTEDTMRAALQVGYNLVSLSGHGNWPGCCGVNVAWVPLLTNGFESGLVYADSCLTNDFNEPKVDGGTPDAVSERFLSNPDGGAVAYLGNSRFSIIGEGSGFEQAFWTNLTANRRLGLAHNSRSMYTAKDTDRWINFTLNLMGDPEMSVWIGEPAKLVVTHPVSVTQGDPLPVAVKTAAGADLEGALVVVTGPRETFLLAESDGSGAASFSTSAMLTGDVMTVTVTKQDFIPYQGTVKIVPVFTRIPRADSNLDGVIDISDAVFIFGALFLGTSQLACPDAADANGDNAVDISDPVTILSFLFLGGRISALPTSCQ